jgi:NHL repeat-containing protein
MKIPILKYFCLMLVFLSATNGHGQSIGVINTVAGTGTPGFSGDGGPATSATLRSPLGIAVDTAGNLFITDTDNRRIRKVTPAGIISTVAGRGTQGVIGDGGPATSAILTVPWGIAVDGAGNLFIADSNNNRVRKVTPDGIINTVAGTGTSGFSGDGGAATSAALSFPSEVLVDGPGNLFIADSGNQRIRKVTPDGIINTVAGTGTSGFSGDEGAATSASGFDASINCRSYSCSAPSAFLTKTSRAIAFYR